MSKLSKTTKLQIALPALSVVLMVLIYFVFDRLFIDCYLAECQSVNGSLISPVVAPTNLKDAEKKLADKKIEIAGFKQKYEDALKEQKNKNNEATNTQLLIGNQQKQLADEQLKTPKLDANVYLANVNAYNTKLTAQTKETNLAQANTDSALTELAAKETDLKNTAGHISARYSKRIFWLFLSAFVFGFTILGIGISVHIILQLPKSLNIKWLLGTSGAAFLGFVLILTTNYYLMSISNSILNSSLYINGDLSKFWVAVTNAVFYLVIVFFASASCAVIYLAKYPKYTAAELSEYEKVKTEIETTANEIINLPLASPPDVTVEAQRSELEMTLTGLRAKFAEMTKTSVQFQEDLRNYSKMILYVGSALLFAGLTRMNVISEWHILFVEKDSSAALTTFMQSVIAVQGGFYSILLATLYFPMAYSIPPKPNAPDGIEATLDKDGFLKTIKEYSPRLIALCSPFLAGPISDLIKYLIGTPAS